MSEAALAARWYDGRSAKGQAVLLRVDGTHGASLLAGDGQTVLARFALRELESSSPVGTGTRFLRLPDGTDLEVDDGVALENALAAGGRPRALPRRLEQRGRYVLAAVVFVVLFVGLGYRYGIPWLANAVAGALPAQTQAMLGGNALEQMDRFILVPSRLHAEQQAHLQELFAGLLTLTGATPAPRLVLRGGGPLRANAFALPDGTVVITDELVLLAGDDDQIVAVMAHEIGHVEHRHLLRAVLQNSAVALLGAVLLGDLESLGALAGALPALLVQAAYSREFEREADAYAVELLRATGRPPQALATMLDRLSEHAGEQPGEDDGLAGYLRSHPPTPERLRALQGAGTQDAR